MVEQEDLDSLRYDLEDKINYRVSNVLDEMDSIDSRLSYLEEAVKKVEKLNMTEEIEVLTAIADALDAKADNIQAKVDLMHAELSARLDEICEHLNLESKVEANPNDHIA